MVQHWWQLTVIALAMVLLAIAGVIFARAPALPHTLAYGLVRQMAAGQAAWQTRNWLEAESAHFRLRYRPEDAALASLVLANAEDVYGPVAGLLAYEPAGKTLIILHPDRQSLARQFGWAASESAMGVYWGGVIRLLSPYDWIASREPEEIATVFTSSGPVAHEFTHLLVDARARGNYPRWLTEGIAQFVEKQLTGFTMPGAPGAGTWYPLGEMDYGFDNLPDQILAYRQSYLMVDYLVRRYGLAVLLQLLDHLGRGVTLEQAFREILGTDCNGFEAAFARETPVSRARVATPAA